MGNEHSKNKDLPKNGKSLRKHENGSANGISANITSNGLEIAAQQNGEPLSLALATESPDFVIVDSDCKPAEAPVISEILETIVQKEEVKESNEDQKDVSLPATDPQPELGSSGEEADTVTIAVHLEDFEYPHRKAETSTQTDRKIEADISTQTGEDDNDTTTNTEGPVEVEGVMETSATQKDWLKKVVEEAANEETLDNQTAGIINEEVMENNVYGNIVFRADRVQVTDIRNYDPEEDSENCHEITEAETGAEPGTVPLELFSNLPKVVADCVEAVFSTVPESTDFVEPNADKVITEDSSEGAGDMSANVVLIETMEPELKAVTTEAWGANDVPSPDEEPAPMAMETISEVVCVEPNPTPSNQNIPVEELVTVLLVKVESAQEEVTAEYAVAVEDVPEICEQEKLDDEPSEVCERCPEEEIIILEAPSNKLITFEGLPANTSISPDDEVKPEAIPEVITTNENPEVGEDATADVGPERVEEAEQNPAFFTGEADVLLEATIDALCQELEFCGILPQEPEVDNDILVEEVISATIFVPLSGEQEASFAIPEAPVAEEMNEEAVEILLNKIKAMPENVEEDTTGGEGTAASNSEEPVEEEKTDVCEEVLAQAERAETTKQMPQTDVTEESAPCVSVQVQDLLEENIAPSKVPTDSNHPEEPMEESAEAVLETIVEEIITHVVAAECNLVTSKEVEPEVLEEGETEEKTENESSVNSTDSKMDSQTVMCSDMDILDVKESGMAEEITEVCEEVLAQAKSAEIPKEISVISEEPEEENPSPCEEDATTEVLENTLESVVAAISGQLEDNQNIVEEAADAPPSDATEESESGVQEELVEENVTPAEVPTYSNHVISEEDVEESVSLVEHLPENNMLVVICKTIEDQVTEEIMLETDNSGDVLAADKENSSVLETIAEEIFTEDAVTTECNLASSEEVTPEVIAEGEAEDIRAEDGSSVNSTDSTLDSQSVTSTDMEALVGRLQSACISVVEESAYGLSGFRLSSLGYRITVTIHVEPKEEQQ